MTPSAARRKRKKMPCATISARVATALSSRIGHPESSLADSQSTKIRPMGMLTKSIVKRDVRARRQTRSRCSTSGIALRKSPPVSRRLEKSCAELCCSRNLARFEVERCKDEGCADQSRADVCDGVVSIGCRDLGPQCLCRRTAGWKTEERPTSLHASRACMWGEIGEKVPFLTAEGAKPGAHRLHSDRGRWSTLWRP